MEWIPALFKLLKRIAVHQSIDQDMKDEASKMVEKMRAEFTKEELQDDEEIVQIG